MSLIAPYPGAGAGDVAEQVERSISSVPGLTQLRSTSANSFAFVIAQFDYAADLDEAVASIEGNLRSAGLPNGVEPTVGAFNFNSATIVVASVSAAGDTDLETVAEIARTEIITELQSLPGVAGADLAGGLEDQLVVTLDPELLGQAGVSTQQIVGVLQANNLTLPGGELSVDGEQIPVSTIGQFTSVDQIENLVVGVRSAPMVPGMPSAAPAEPAPHPDPADPDDGDRDDPGTRPARGGVQRGLDHRRRTRDGGHRRAAQRDLPDAARRARGVLTDGGSRRTAPPRPLPGSGQERTCSRARLTELPPSSSTAQTGRSAATTPTTRPMASAHRPSWRDRRRSIALASASATVSDSPNVPKLKIPRDPNPAQNFSHAWR